MEQVSFIIINVLDVDSYKDCHIPSSISIPFSELKGYAQSRLNRDTRIIVYCAHYQCSKSREAAGLLSRLGFEHVEAYEGGMAEWYQMGFASAGVCAADYLKTHHEHPPKISNEYNIATITALELKKLLDEQ